MKRINLLFNLLAGLLVMVLAGCDNSKPIITFDAAVYDFGKIAPASQNKGSFRFTNTGDKTLKLEKKIAATCGCTIPQLEKTHYKPGQSGTIKVSYHAGTYHGPAKKQLYVKSNDKENPNVELIIKAQIVPKVVHLPKSIKLSRQKENAGCSNIKLTSTDGKPFAIKAFSSTADIIAADFEPEIEKTEFIIKPKIDVEKLTATSGGKIIIGLSHPDSSEIMIRFYVARQYKSRPASIILWKAETNSPAERELWISGIEDTPFELGQISSQNGCIEVVDSKKIDNRYRLNLKITPPKLEVGSRVAKDVLLVNIKDGPELKINCTIMYKKL